MVARAAIIGALGLVSLLTGCARTPFLTYENGPVALHIGDVRHVCAASGVIYNRGCTMRYPNGRIEVYCADGDYECIAHELRHVADPGWRHDLDARTHPATAPAPASRAPRNDPVRRR